MPDIAADRLTNVVAAVFRHAGCDDVESLRVADNLVTANLTGHDSHGVIRTLRYVDWMAMGLIKAGQDIRIAQGIACAGGGRWPNGFWSDGGAACR